MKISVEIPDERVEACIDAADTRRWARKSYQGHLAGQVRVYADLEDNALYHADTERIACGVEALATVSPKQFARLVSDEYDAATGDRLVQCICFGKLKYA